MALMPSPRRLDNCLEALILRPPTEISLDLVRACHEARRVTGPSRPWYGLDGPPGHLLGHGNYLFHRVPVSIAHVICGARRAAFKRLKSQQMRVSQIGDVDV